jgi:hypothetical protein
MMASSTALHARLSKTPRSSYGVSLLCLTAILILTISWVNLFYYVLSPDFEPKPPTFDRCVLIHALIPTSALDEVPIPSMILLVFVINFFFQLSAHPP